MNTKSLKLTTLAVCVLLLLMAGSDSIRFSASQVESSVTIPCSGVVQQTSTGTYTYIISVSGSNYQMTDGTTGQIDYQSTNATQVINDAVGNLTRSQSILFSSGTYNLNGSITGTNENNITLAFKNGATLFVSNGMNTPAIYLNNCNNWLIQNATINGNAAYQVSDAGVFHASEIGIWIGVGCTNCLVDRANITNCGQFGVFIADSPLSTTMNDGVTNSLFTFCGWNAITFGLNTSNCYANNNQVAYSGDVGISDCGAGNSSIQNNYVHDINGTAGAVNSQWGIANEEGAGDTITGNTITNCTMAIEITASCNSNIITYNNITNGNYGIILGSNNNLVEYNNITNFDTPSSGDEALVSGNSNNNQFINNTIYSSRGEAHSIEVYNSANTQIVGNSIVVPATGGSWFSIHVYGTSTYTMISNNSIVGYMGIYIDSATCRYTTVEGNNLTQCNVYGKGGMIVDSGTSTSIYDNAGYNPLGTIVNPINGSYIMDGFGSSNAIWTSGTTYTNWESPKVLYISGGTVSNVAQNGVTLFTATGCTVTLQPGDTFSVTFSTAPAIDVVGQ